MPNQIFGYLAQDWVLYSLDSVGSERHFLRKKRWMPFECAELNDLALMRQFIECVKSSNSVALIQFWVVKNRPK